MVKKALVIIAALLMPFIIMAEAGEIGKDHWSYKDIQDLVDSGIITKPLTKDSLTRDEVVTYINNGVENVLAANTGSKGSDAALMDKINKLYNLVKAYMTDLMRSEKKLDEIIETIGDLKVKKKEIEQKQNKLMKLMGMRINGDSAAYMTDVLLYGNNFAAASQRYRPITQYIDLKFSLHANKDLYAEATFRLENLFGGFWGSQDIYGLKRFFIQGDYPVSFLVGDYQGKLTPYTLWAVDDERPLEAKVFKDKRDMNKKELYLMDNTWPLTGGKVHTILEIVDKVDVGIQLLLARLGEAGKSNYRTYDPSSGIFMPTSYNHDQYLFAGRINTDGSLHDMLDVGLNYLEIIDAKDTGTFTAPVIHNYVMSADAHAEVDVAEGIKAKIGGEFAMSHYNNSKFTGSYVKDSAYNGGVEVSAFGINVKARYKAAGNSFTAYAAQTRMYDSRINAEYLTQNSTWNIDGNPPSYIIGGRIYPFTQYNPTINVSYGDGVNSFTGMASYPENMLGHELCENNVYPYGDSTPNRQGIELVIDGSYDLEDMAIISPYVKFDTATQQVEELAYNTTTAQYDVAIPKKSYMSIEGGAKVEVMMVTVGGGIKMTDTNNTAEGGVVDFKSTIIDAGAEVEIMKKKLFAYAGYKSISYAGYEYGYFYDAGLGEYVYGINPNKADTTIDSIGVGLEYRIAKPATIGLAFSTTNITDNEDASQSFGVQELDVTVKIEF